MTTAYINKIATAVPPHDVHQAFLGFVAKSLDARSQSLFTRMAGRAGIAARYSVLHPQGMVEANDPHPGFYRRGAYPGTAARMNAYKSHAPALAEQAVAGLSLGAAAASITHLIVASCTGFMAPGLDQLLAQRLGLRADLQRSLLGFMGCSAAVPALRLAQAAVLADPTARVLVVNLELCTLHMQETADLQTALCFMLFGDGASASLVTAEPAGIALGDFRACLIADSADMITWHIGDQGFEMHLSGQVPGKITQALREDQGNLLRHEGTQAIELWAVHGGGRSVLDAVETGFSLKPQALAVSRHILHRFGNMSSATIMFALQKMLLAAGDGEARGLAMAFGPGMVAETFRFTRLH